MTKKLVILFALFTPFLFAPNVFAQIYINEVLPDPSGDEKTDEWIELYNSGDLSFDVNEYVIKDIAENELIISPETAGGSTTIEAKLWLVVRRNGNQAWLNNNGEESISLYKADNLSNPIDTFVYKNSDVDRTWGRFPDGGSISDKSLDPSAGNANISPPTPSPTKSPTPKPTQTPVPTESPIPTATLTPRPTKEPTKAIEDEIQDIPETAETLGDNDEEEMNKEIEEEPVNEEQKGKLPLASLAFIVGGLSFVGAGAYPYIRKYLNGVKKGSKNDSQKIKL